MPSNPQFRLTLEAQMALAELCSLMVRKYNKRFTINTAIIQAVEDMKEEEQEANRSMWATLIGEYENLDGAEGGRLRHEPCGQVVTRAILNRENLELMLAHVDECGAAKNDR
jgi:hypothetical protein